MFGFCMERHYRYRPLFGGDGVIVGTLEVELYLGEALTLKDRRRVLKGVIQRIRTKFNVSIAEVGRQDARQRAVLGIACVSNQTAQVHSILSNVTNFLELQQHIRVISVKTEIL